MRFTVTSDDGTDVEFECADNFVSRWVCGDILAGSTYPWLPFIGTVDVILDGGANCGAASAYFARHCPGATIHAFEPASAARAILDRNAADYPNISVHPFGLHSRDQTVALHKGTADSSLSSVFPSERNDLESEPVGLRSAGGWAAEQGIERIDVMKLDVEGCEIEVLHSLEPLLPTMKAFYVEYDSRAARREIERLMLPSHELYCAKLLLDQGEVTYLRRDLAELPVASSYQVELFNAQARRAG